MNSQTDLFINQAIQHFQSGDFVRAQHLLNKVLLVESENLAALHILGLINATLSNYAEAALLFKKAVSINPGDPSLHYNLAKVLLDSGSLNESLPYHQKATELAPDNSDAWLNYGKCLSGLDMHEKALTFYEQSILINPNNFVALINKSASLNELGRYQEAIIFSDRAITIAPQMSEPWVNKGLAQEQLNLDLEALKSYEKAATLNPNHYKAWRNIGVLLCELKMYDDGIHSLTKAFKLNADSNYLLGNLIQAKLMIAMWDQLNNDVNLVIDKINLQKKVIAPFSLLAITDCPKLQKDTAEIWVNDNFPSNIIENYPHKELRSKIRIGYFSADFKNHPVAHLTAEIIELHNREQFEVFGFSLKPADPNDQMHQRLSNGFDQFIDVSAKSDKEISQLAKNLEIDIAIDLGGHTHGSRTGLFSYRASPIQVNYLGYPGTMGAKYYDYIIADPHLIPEENRQFYTEAVAYMPNSYMVDDSKRIATNKFTTRAEYNLPEDKFIFCCFNNSYKFNPKMLSMWSKILRQVENSVFWIPENNPSFKKNIVNEFVKLGINKERIVFSQKVSLMEDHLARLKLADLFLDTHPYNAHTTALDALKQGLPLITLTGKTFAARVAGSLLRSVNLSKLITTTEDEYVAIAVDFGRNPEKLLPLKAQLTKDIPSSPLFNARLFTMQLECLYKKMIEIRLLGTKPEAIFTL
jgi:protein O-GlcNAc transferase